MPAGRLRLIRAASFAKDLVPLSFFLWYDNSKITIIQNYNNRNDQRRFYGNQSCFTFHYRP